MRVERQHWHITGKVLTAVIVIAVFATGITVALLIHHGLSARSEPTLLETVIARSVRHLATPAPMRGVRNPVPLTADALADARAHWADHCATCHGNDGSGDTEIGRGLYPKPPDMRKPVTQNLTDGELFSIIRNGVRLTGMPAWGDAAGHDDADNWKLVHFIRHLPKLTPEELARMEALNPKTPEEWQRAQEEAAFLAGGDETTAHPMQSHHTHDH
jgi:mono/diheme cytochrome c family protein